MLNYEFRNSNVIFRVKSSEETLYLIGSFTNWLILEEFKMNKFGDEFILEKHITNFEKIGNSGYAEYYFGNHHGKLNFDKFYPQGYFFNNQVDNDFNYLLLPENISLDKVEEIIEANRKSFVIKNKPQDFKNYEELTNFRQVTGGEICSNILFRSYHPIVQSRQENNELKDIELIRQQILLDLLEKHEINTIINLSETKEKLNNYIENISFNYYKKLYLDNKIFNVPMSYETVYFLSSENISIKSGEFGFQDGIKQIIRVIANNKGPYLIHCELGSDRTGVISAFLQLFMGASKDEVEENYIKTNNLGIGEYRSFNLLEFCLKKVFGNKPYGNKDNIWNFLEKLDLEKDCIERAYHNLYK